MPIQHTTRRGEVYTLIESATAGGKAKYHFSRKRGGKPAATLPAGYEIFESAAGQVFLRPIGSALIHPEEVETVAASLRKPGWIKGFEAWPNKRDITVYDFNTVDDGLYDRLHGCAPLLTSRAEFQASMLRNAQRVAVMRFVLLKPEARVFAPERYRFRGSNEGWNPIGEPGALEPLCRKFLPHVGKESLYEL